MEKLLLRPAEVAEMIGVGRSKAYELISSGEIPSVLIGRCVRVPAEGLREHIDELVAKGVQKRAPQRARKSSDDSND